MWKNINRFISLAIGAGLIFSTAFASEDKIGEVSTKGIFLKDGIDIMAFDDPDIKGVACHTTMATRNLLKRMTGSENPSDSSLACRQVGPVDCQNVGESENIFSRSRNIFFKTTRVDRFYDQERDVLIYLVYTTATGGNNRSHTISTVPLMGVCKK